MSESNFQPNPTESDSTASPVNTAPQQAMPPASWYPDPAGTGLERYWNGSQWTYDTRQPQSAPGFAAAMPQQPVQQATQQPVQPYQPQQPYSNPTQQLPYGDPYGYRNQGGFTQGNGRYTADGVRLAGWWSRVAAVIIDTIILSFLQSVILSFVGSAIVSDIQTWERDVMNVATTGVGNIPSPFNSAYGNSYLVFTGIAIGLSFLYGLFSQQLMAATPGQRLFGLRVVFVDRGRGPYRLAWGSAIVRNLVWAGLMVYRLFPTMPIILFGIVIVAFINILFPLFNRRRQALHDIAARTQVITLRP